MSLTLRLQATDLIEHGGTQLALLVTDNRGTQRQRVLKYCIGRGEAS